MSALRMNFARRAPVYRSFGAVTTRSFQSCRVLAAGKESALHDEDRPEKVEYHKQDQLQKQKEGKGHWKDELASDSESIIKADRGDIDASKGTIEQLQKETAKLAEGELQEKTKKNKYHFPTGEAMVTIKGSVRTAAQFAAEVAGSSTFTASATSLIGSPATLFLAAILIVAYSAVDLIRSFERKQPTQPSAERSAIGNLSNEIHPVFKHANLHGPHGDYDVVMAPAFRLASKCLDTDSLLVTGHYFFPGCNVAEDGFQLEASLFGGMIHLYRQEVEPRVFGLVLQWPNLEVVEQYQANQMRIGARGELPPSALSNAPVIPYSFVEGLFTTAFWETTAIERGADALKIGLRTSELAIWATE
ncbi:hypothetical protein LTR85_009772 [Meristemomyces frigidus]|nr:hypothetical protein LTR85_009772 [Meristemomyces frigidus]